MAATGLEQLIHSALLRAQAKQQRLTVEHALTALIDSSCLDEFWCEFKVDTEALKAQLEAHVAETARPIDTGRPDGHVTPELTQFITRTLMHASLHRGTGEVRVDMCSQPCLRRIRMQRMS